MQEKINLDECLKDQLPLSYFSANRKRLSDQLDDPSLAIILSGRPPHRTSDETYPFSVNRNFYYLSGLDQEECVLLLIRRDGQSSEILYIQEQDPIFERWRGHRVSLEEAGAFTGITDIRLIGRLRDDLIEWLSWPNLSLWLDGSALDSQAMEMKQWLADISCDRPVKHQDLEPILTRLRMIKCKDELDQIKKAIHLTKDGVLAMLSCLKPGLMEYHLWAEFAYSLAKSGCLSPAFPSIVASGEHIFCLHYMTPYAQIQEGDLVQVDVGAASCYLCADISRVFPAGGQFTDQQKKVYQIVRQCQITAFETIRPGMTLQSINEACHETARRGLMDAGFMKPDEPIKDYFWHNVSHHLGLDVHDVSEREAPLQPGMVLTVEPGIYIPAAGIGMRIEDDVVVTNEGCLILSEGIMREAEEIEAFMSQAH